MKKIALFAGIAFTTISCSGGSSNDSPSPQDQQTSVKCQDQTEWQNPPEKSGDTQSQKVAKFIAANLSKVKAANLADLNRTYENCLKPMLEN